VSGALDVIDAVVFDVGGVLTPSPVESFFEVDRAYALAPGTAMSFFRGGALFSGCEVGTLAFADFCEQAVAEIRADQGIAVPPSAMSGVLDACMGEDLRHDMLALVAEVKAVGHRVGLLTNIFAERREWLHGLLPDGTVDVFADSSELGLRKPDTAIYDALVTMLGCPAERIAYVDDFAENLGPAADLGMTTVLFEDPAQVRRALVEAGVRIPAVVEVC
jgi:epoxide hydrolase-like predicted phosphatase